jgi:hypothetical protein
MNRSWQLLRPENCKTAHLIAELFSKKNETAKISVSTAALS